MCVTGDKQNQNMSILTSVNTHQRLIGNIKKILTFLCRLNIQTEISFCNAFFYKIWKTLFQCYEGGMHNLLEGGCYTHYHFSLFTKKSYEHCLRILHASNRNKFEKISRESFYYLSSPLRYLLIKRFQRLQLHSANFRKIMFANISFSRSRFVKIFP